MRRGLIAFLFVFFAFGVAFSAGVPPVITYQGLLTDSSGTPVADGDYDVVLKIYDVSSGGAPLWSSGTVSVTVSNGVFSYPLGSVSPFPSNLFTEEPDLWLGITVESDPEIDPRIRLTSAGWAFHSAATDSVVNGPGVVQHVRSIANGVLLVNGFAGTYVTEDTIFAPDSGWALVQVTADMQCSYTAGTNAGGALELRDSTLVHQTDQEFLWIIPSASPGGIYGNPFHIHRVFKVRPGRNIFTVIGADFLDPGNFFTVNALTMTITYFPYSYGTVQMTPSPAIPGSEQRTIPMDEDVIKRWRERALGNK